MAQGPHGRKQVGSMEPALDKAKTMHEAGRGVLLSHA